MKIKVKITEKTFGKFLAAPACEKARRFCLLLKQDYLNEDQIFHIRKLGFAIEVVK